MQGSQSERSGVGDLVHVVVVFVLSLAPPWVASEFPAGVLEDKNETFIKIYVLTLPWSLAVSIIFVGFLRGWFGDDAYHQLGWVAGILIGSLFVGALIAPGSVPALEAELRGGPPWFTALQVIFLIVVGYALLYGWHLWLASYIVAVYVGWWVHEKTRGQSQAATEGGSVVSVAGPASVVVAAPTTRPDGLDSLTKDELYARAKAAGIEGRSTMSRAELLDVLRAKRS